MRKIPVLTFDITKVTIEQARAEFARLCAQLALEGAEKLVWSNSDGYELRLIPRRWLYEHIHHLPRTLCRKRHSFTKKRTYGRSITSLS
jgi:hypothetical protein